MASELPKVELDFRAWFWRWLRRPGWSVILPVLLIVFTGVFAWQIFFSQSELDKGLTALKATYRTARPVEARIAAFGYAPFEAGASRFDENQLKRAEDWLLVKTKDLHTPALLHARGQFHLARGSFDNAIQQFEAALKLDPNNAPLHSDLGVAWLEKATHDRASSQSNQLFAQSRQHLEQALQLDANHLEALFNLALLEFRQSLWKQAEERWQLYLKKDERSGWAQEAKTYLNRSKALQQQTINSNV